MSKHQLFALLPLIGISITVIAVMLAICIRRHFAATSLIAALGMTVSLLVVVSTATKTPVEATFLIIMDDYGRFYIGLLLVAGLAVIGFSYDYFKERKERDDELLILISTAILGGSVLAVSSHFASFFLGLEILSVSLFALIGYCYERAHALEAAIKYLILSGLSSAFLLMGMAFIYARCGALSFANTGLCFSASQELNIMALGGLLFILAGLGFKLSLVPFHLWTPDVYEGASAPVTAFIATVSKGAVFIVLLRLLSVNAGQLSSALLNVIGIISAITILGGNLLALLQRNVKRLLAYSSISHLGYLLLAIMAVSSGVPNLAFETVNFYFIAYFIATLGAFGTVSLLSTAQKEPADISAYRGLFWRSPWLAGVFTLMLLSLAGIPLTAGFIGKFYIFAAGAEVKLWALLIIVIIGSGLGLFYYLRVILAMAEDIKMPVDKEAVAGGKKLSSFILALLAFLIVWFGIFPERIIDSIRLSPASSHSTSTS